MRTYLLPDGPRVLVLDSKGFIHNFTYYDTRYEESMLIDLREVDALRGDELKPTVHANRSLITTHHLSQRPSIQQSQKDPLVFEYQGSCKAICDWEFTGSNDNPYMLGIISFFCSKKT